MAVRGIVRYESVTVSSTAIGIDATGSSGNVPRAATITVEDATIRFRADGSDPTATEGHEAGPGTLIELISRDEVERFRGIRRDGVDATIRVTSGVEWTPD